MESVLLEELLDLFFRHCERQSREKEFVLFQGGGIFEFLRHVVRGGFIRIISTDIHWSSIDQRVIQFQGLTIPFRIGEIHIAEAFRFALGTQDTAQWNPGASGTDLPSISSTANVKRTEVFLVCSNNSIATLEALGEKPVKVDQLRLIHPCACWNGCLSQFPRNGRCNAFESHVL